MTLRIIHDNDFIIFNRWQHERGEQIVDFVFFPSHGVVCLDDGKIVGIAYLYVADDASIAHGAHYTYNPEITNAKKIHNIIKNLQKGLIIVCRELNVKCLMTTVNPKLSKILKRLGGIETHPVETLLFEVK